MTSALLSKSAFGWSPKQSPAAEPPSEVSLWPGLLIGAGTALLLAWAALVVALVLARPRGALLAEALRLLPDVLRLIRRLAADPGLPRGVRIRIGALLVYLASPVDLIPDFIPLLGYADDAIIVTAVLRSVVHRGYRLRPRALARHRRRLRRAGPAHRPARHHTSGELAIWRALTRAEEGGDVGQQQGRQGDVGDQAAGQDGLVMRAESEGRARQKPHQPRGRDTGQPRPGLHAAPST
jgi:uncharacterized membrane protein YkvA (DUF1232 family)